ncbi:hypothetical protein QFZ27_002439 [Inquilinus ginsengisoli]|uniref:hypothetical protein n=1 Tax=Inquilinus ginsengisoli TaxID=363840 RepID=UPI003D1CF5C5
MEPTPADLDVQAFCRSLALQQIQMLTRLAEIAMQLAEGEGVRAVAAQARAAQPKADEAAVQTARAEAQEAWLAFSRFSRTVQRSLALRARAADTLCAREKAQAAEREATREARRDGHRNQVEETLHEVIWQEIEDPRRAAALQDELDERVDDLYDSDEPVEDRPLGSVMAGLACGLGITEEWRRWAGPWQTTPRPARPAGGEAEIQAERARRRDTARAVLERAFARLDPARVPGLKAGLAVRLQEADVIKWFDTETTYTIAERPSRSLGIDPYLWLHSSNVPDTG